MTKLISIFFAILRTRLKMSANLTRDFVSHLLSFYISRFRKLWESKRYRPIHQSVSSGTQAPSIPARSKAAYWTAFCTSKRAASEICEPPVANSVAKKNLNSWRNWLQQTLLVIMYICSCLLHRLTLVMAHGISFEGLVSEWFIYRRVCVTHWLRCKISNMSALYVMVINICYRAHYSLLNIKQSILAFNECSRCCLQEVTKKLTSFI